MRYEYRTPHGVIMIDDISLFNPEASPLTVLLDTMKPRIVLTWRGREKSGMVWRNKRWQYDNE